MIFLNIYLIAFFTIWWLSFLDILCAFAYCVFLFNEHKRAFVLIRGWGLLLRVTSQLLQGLTWLEITTETMDPSPKTKGLRLYPRQWNLELVGAARLQVATAQSVSWWLFCGLKLNSLRSLRSQPSLLFTKFLPIRSVKERLKTKFKKVKIPCIAFQNRPIRDFLQYKRKLSANVDISVKCPANNFPMKK